MLLHGIHVLLSCSLPSSAPRLRLLTATSQPNNTITVEWQLEFTGGYPVTDFLVTVEALLSRGLGDGPGVSRRETSGVWSFHLGPEEVESGSLVTEVLPVGQGYRVTAIVTNQIGEREKETNGNCIHC